ncbi:class I SAM-dependent methyltransferase [Streptomyces olivoreticuli]
MQPGTAADRQAVSDLISDRILQLGDTMRTNVETPGTTLVDLVDQTEEGRPIVWLLHEDERYNGFYDRPTILRLIGDVRGQRVLDAGCGPGLYLVELISRGAKAIGFDQSSDMVRHARGRVGPGVHVRQHDLDDPLDWLPDKAVDLILATLVIHYVRDRIAALRELSRVLRPQGQLIVSTSHPTADWLADGASYFDARYVEENWSCGMVHRYWQQPLQHWIEDFTAAGLIAERIVEHRSVPEMVREHPAAYDRLSREPGFIAFQLTKRAAH